MYCFFIFSIPSVNETNADVSKSFSSQMNVKKEKCDENIHEKLLELQI